MSGLPLSSPRIRSNASARHDFFPAISKTFIPATPAGEWPSGNITGNSTP
ncbi:hypothetical protein HMPREF3039_02455 [Akkermansia sp. KLE1798]|nr:hypothetical protein HMPREF3039_02455 [Akkermansia sp. KLE1798]KZA05191.1 hypothetical protein HMPREF1326_01227 [Akkermansia sp. KLE1605]